MIAFVAFLFRLAEDLGKTVAELVTGRPQRITKAEVYYWIDYREKYGLKIDRIEYAVANGAAAQCNAWGAKYNPRDFIPKFGTRRTGKKALVFSLAGLAGAVVEFIPKDGGKVLRGTEALAMLDGYKEGERRGGRTLDEKPKERERRGTLAGD